MDHNGRVTFQEFIDFCVESHLGFITLQRMHRNRQIERGYCQQINQIEFGNIMRSWLGKFALVITQCDIDNLWKQIDCDQDGLISYTVFLLFLRKYFVSECSKSARILPDDCHCKSDEEKFWEKYKCYSAKERFSRSVTDQIKNAF